MAPMLYDIALHITYAYEHPANAGRHLLRVTPADLPGEQRLLTSSLDVTPAEGERTNFRDFFGNEVVRLAIAHPHDRLGLRVRARVERSAPPRSAALDARSAPLRGLGRLLAETRTLDALSPHHFVAPSTRVPSSAALRAYARDAVDLAGSALDAVLTLGAALHADLRFDADATTVDTPVEEAFEARHGVCQDFAHIMIGCLREVGVPAGYVSGFLRTEPPPGQARLEGADAMHAWVRAWCGPDLGWLEFDPTNGVRIVDDHVVAARGRDYSDVAPVRGVLRTAGTQRSRLSVDVIPLAERAAGGDAPASPSAASAAPSSLPGTRGRSSR